MEPLSGAVLSALGSAILNEAGKHAVESTTGALRQRVFGRAERRAVEKALARAYEHTAAEHGRRLGDFDVNPDFLRLEGAAELAKALVPGQKPSPRRLAERCVDSLAPDLDEDTRWDRLVLLGPVFKTLAESLATELRREAALTAVLDPVERTTTATAAERVVHHLGAAQATGDDEAVYLHWMVDCHRYLRTVGMVRNSSVQLELRDVFVGLSARRHEPDDRARAWFEQEEAKLRLQLASGGLDQLTFEAALDRLRIQLGPGLAPLTERSQPETLPILEAVGTNRHLVVLGDPGSGKTTLLKYLALAHAQARATGGTIDGLDPSFPIYLRIGDFARSAERGKGVSAFLPDQLRRQECRTPGLADLLDRRLAAGDCLVLFDGLDEINSADDRRAVVEAVTSFVTAYSRQGNRFVVTSRIAGYHAAPLPPPFDEVRLLDMDDPTVDRFLDNYCPTVERLEAPKNSDEKVRRDAALSADAIKDSLRQHPGVRRLAANPLLLTALILVHRARGRLPHRRVDAYVEVTEALGRTWRNVQGVPEAELPDDRMLTTWLTRLGSWLHEHRPEGSASLRELVEVLGPLWAQNQGIAWDPATLEAANPLETDAGHGVRRFVEQAELHTGLLVERAPGRYGFPHLTFEEYYAGRALAFEGRAVDRAAGIRRRLHNPRYEEPSLLALGLIGREQPEELESLVAEAIYPGTDPHPYEHLLGWDFLFALRLLADDVPLLPTTIDRLLNQAVDEWLAGDAGRCRFFKYREVLGQRLTGLGSTKAAERLSSLIIGRAETASAVTSQFCSLIEAVFPGGAVPEPIGYLLAHVLTSSDDPPVLMAALATIHQGQRIAPEQARQLLSLVQQVHAHEVKRSAIAALAHSQPSSASDQALIEIATRGPDLSIRAEALCKLSERGISVSPALQDVIESIRKSPDTDSQAMLAVSSFYRHSGTFPEAVTSLIELSDQAESTMIRHMAVLCLGMLPEHKAAVSTLARLATGSWDDFRTGPAAAALTNSSLPIARRTLSKLVMNWNSPGLSSAAASLSSKDELDEQELGFLVALSQKPHLTITRVNAFAGLVKRGDASDSTITSLIEAASENGSAAIRIAAARLLDQIDLLPPEMEEDFTTIVESHLLDQYHLKMARFLARRGSLRPETVKVIESLNPSDVKEAGVHVAREFATLLGELEPTPHTIRAALVLLWTSEPTAQTAGNTLLGFARRHPDRRFQIQRELADSVTAPVSQSNPAFDHAYQTFWAVTATLAAES